MKALIPDWIKMKDYQVILNHFKSINKAVFFEYKDYVVENYTGDDLQKRLRWDCLFNFYNNKSIMLYFVVDVLYSQGINDEHLDVALKKAMKESGLLAIAEEKAC